MATLDDIKSEFRVTWDSGDAWGSAMQWAFAVAEESYFNRDGQAASVLEYTPGAGIPDLSENYGADLLAEMTDSDLLHFAILLDRLTAILERKGLNY